MFIAFLYMFQVTMCPSSGETTVSMWHLVFVVAQIQLFLLMMGTVAQNMWRKEINILRKIVHQVGCIYKIIHRCTVNKT